MATDLLAWLMTGGVILLGLGIGAVVVYVDVKQRHQVLERLAADAGAVVVRGALPGGASLLGRTRGRDYSGIYLHRQHGASVFQLSIRAHVPADLVVAKRSLPDRALVGTGLVPDLMTGNDQFDTEFKLLVRGGTASSGFSDVVSSHSWQEAVADLFQEGISRLEYLGETQTLQVIWDPANKLFDRKGMLLNPMANRLIDLEQLSFHLEADQGAMDDGSDDRHFVYLYIGYAAMLAFGGFAAMVGEVEYEPLSHVSLFILTAAVAGFLWCGFTWLGFRFTRLHVYGHHHFLGLAVMGAICIPVAVYALLVIANGTLGHQVPDVQQLLVTKKYREEANGTFHHYVRADGQIGRDRRIGRSDYPLIRPGETMIEITTYPGWLGVAWSTPDHIHLLNRDD